ncbi:acyl-CoA thioesterase [Phnomibacter ginsenosidimutans]|uniref:Thioesterase n=1 Tax=Phnomibacter ginsenosidimutans TaxID=2676868 RepID=A0A6I6GKU7_9BACT|nr:thioesterase family protein [Phnomibacter ginsenosidimutans]QGW29065.1 thioesterase [Phnomibacter ginsenosidimutans]
MPRIKIPQLSHYPFSVDIPVRISDLNYADHVGNDSFLSIMHDARMLYLMSRGYSEMNVEGFGLIMADAGVEYKAQLKYGDVVKVEVGLDDFSSVGFDVYYRLTVQRNGQHKIAALGKTGMVLFDFQAQKMTPISDELKARLIG